MPRKRLGQVNFILVNRWTERGAPGRHRGDGMAARAAYLAGHASTSALNRPHGPAKRPSRAARRHRTLARCDANVNDVSEQSSATPRSRSIVVMCHHVTPHARAGLFSPANLLQGRVDVWCRCVTAGLYLSDAIRTNSTVHLVLQSDDLASCRLVSVDGATVEGLAPAERTVALLLQRAMQHASLDELPTLAREAPGRRRKEKASSVDDDDDDANNEGKSMRNAERRRRGWLAGQPGSRGPVPGIAVSDHHSLERALAWAMRGCGAVTLLDMDGDDAETVLGRVSFFSFTYGQLV